MLKANGNSTGQDEDLPVYQGQSMQIVVPSYALAHGSLKIKPKSSFLSLERWQKRDQVETQQFLKKIIHAWERQGITDYLIFAKDSEKDLFSSGIEIIPYSKKHWRVWQQVKVMWHVAFRGQHLSWNQKEQIAQDFLSHDTLEHLPLEPQIVDLKRDVFCQKSIIDKQILYEGKTINLLYNHVPLVKGQERLRFLVIPKAHRMHFSDLSCDEYVEASSVAKKLIHFYRQQGFYAMYLFDKNGAEAGQTIPHWHEHLLFIGSSSQEWLGKLLVLKNILIGTKPLPEEELKKIVSALREQLAPIFKDAA